MNRLRLPLLDDHAETWFPPVDHALRNPDGLLAVGGRLSCERLQAAYAAGIFPWFEEGQPPLWWSPDPRAVLFPEDLRVARSLAKRLRNGGFTVSYDRCFDDVVAACATPRPGQHGTWITADMQRAYRALHHRGMAHSVEVWHGDELAGGLYGICLGSAFFGESMFSRRADASKVGLVHLVRALQDGGLEIVDCQMGSQHLTSLGAVNIPRPRFLRILERAVAAPLRNAPWEALP